MPDIRDIFTDIAAAGIGVLFLDACTAGPRRWLRYKLARRRQRNHRIPLPPSVAPPGGVLYQCGCMPCPWHAAAHAERERHRADHAEWAARMHEEMRRDT